MQMKFSNISVRKVNARMEEAYGVEVQLNMREL